MSIAIFWFWILLVHFVLFKQVPFMSLLSVICSFFVGLGFSIPFGVEHPLYVMQLVVPENCTLEFAAGK